jgi:hypothetical protein
MKRETRANLLFIGLFLAISLPGAVVLFKKKMDPTSAPMGMPDFVRRRLPYMVPLSTPDNQVTRVVPPLTGAWVADVHREQGGDGPVLMKGPLPVTSKDRNLQVTGLTETASGTSIFLLAWEGGFGVEPARYRVEAESKGERFSGRVVAARAVTMPTNVKRELMSGGYVKPSPEVVWIELAFDAAVSGKRPLALRVAYDGIGEQASSVVHVPGE